ncbi:probable DNA double-strand break repair Rad50 ATPase isoform X7 [Montipora foliosa]|uniref:probable DNA double-strand break repair Rad50 ATPase isoform X7 n=1 Tax=Montipora foliosa TaxID=591990 RepID=UPI0035F1080C
MTSSGQSAWNPNDPLTEGVIYEKRLADDIGQQWRDLARALGFHHSIIEDIQQEKGNSKECCIEVLVRWLRQNGKGATAGKLVEALTKIGLKNLADRFPIKSSDTNRNSKENGKVRELEDRVSKMENKNIKELEKEVSKMTLNNKELEEEVSKLRAINKELQDGEKQEVEVSKMKTKNKELEEEVSKLRAINKKLQDGEKQEVEVSKFKELEEEVSKMKHNNKELEEEVSKLRAINKELQDGEKREVEVSKMKTKNKELEEEVSKLRAINKELQDGEKQDVEVSKMKTKNKELEEEVSKLRAINKKLQDGEKQEVEVSKIKELEEEVSKMKNKNKELEEEISKIKELEEEVDKMKNKNKELEEEDLEHKLSKETDEEARERRISAKLQKYIRDLKTYVTSSLEVPEVKQDQLKTPVKLGILKTLSEHLGDLYIGIRDMVSETCKCSEDLKREFYDFGYHGLRADHNELIHRVQDLEDTVEEMNEEEKEELQKLKEFQMNRESLIKELEEKWRALFSPPERLSRTRSFLTIGRGEKSTDNKKVKRNTDPGTRPKQRNIRDKRLQNPKHFSIGRKTLKRLQFGTLHYQRLNES